MAPKRNTWISQVIHSSVHTCTTPWARAHNNRDTINGNAHLCRHGFCSLFARVSSICSVIYRYLQLVLFAEDSLCTRLSIAGEPQEYDGPRTHTYLALHRAITNRNCTHTSPQTRQQHCAIYEGAERQSTKSPEVAWPGSQVDMQEFSGSSDGRQTCPAAYNKTIFQRPVLIERYP